MSARPSRDHALALESRRHAERGMGEGDGLEQRAHAGAALAGQARRARRRSRRPCRRAALALSAAARVSMPRRRRNSRLLDRAVHAAPMPSAACASAWKSTCAVRSTLPGAVSGSAIGVLADRLQRVAGGAFGMAVVDHQRGAAVARDRRPSSSATLSARHSKIAPIGRLAHRRRQQLVELRDRIGRDREGEIAVGIDLDQRARASRRSASPPD